MVTDEGLLNVFDYGLDFCLKLITIGIIVFLIYYVNHNLKDKKPNSFLMFFISYFMKIIYYPTFVFLPLVTLLFLREYSFVDLMGYVWVIYGILISIGGVLFLVGGYELLAKILGFDSYKSFVRSRCEYREVGNQDLIKKW